jgi:hypothetical protein
MAWMPIPIRILQNVAVPSGSGSTTLLHGIGDTRHPKSSHGTPSEYDIGHWVYINFYFYVVIAPFLQMETISEAVKTSSQIPQGFKDLIARRCEDKGIIFRYVPKETVALE